jgi:alkanesulfonate monooxygenase SsuD/methylene tetrahydromethanopterin reductase-like flavin-dependent oxidoreductase (luciferase family)
MQVVVPDDLRTSTLAQWVKAAERLDHAGCDMILFGEPRPDDPLDALSIASFCSASTERIGLCVTVDTRTVEPFTFARGLASLDHLSGGRAAWRCVGDTEPQRAQEFAQVVSALLQSWGPDALVERRDEGILSAADAVQPVLHDGTFFHSRGPLNVPRPPQGVPPLIALQGDAVHPEADFVLEDADLLRCSIAGIDDIPPLRGPTPGTTLRERMGIVPC